MNKIYLDKLSEFSMVTYKNYDFSNKNFCFDEIVNSVKQNQSLNEKGIFLKHNFIELKLLAPNIEYDQLILTNPLCFNLCGNIEWFNFLNGLLTILNDAYIHENNLIKKTIIETTDKTFKKKLFVDDDILTREVIDKICILTNIMLIIIENTTILLYNFDDKKNNKTVVLYKNGKEYYPVINWNQKYFYQNSNFIEHLIELGNKKVETNLINQNLLIDEQDNFEKVKNKKKNIKINSNVKIDNYENNLSKINIQSKKNQLNKLNENYNIFEDFDKNKNDQNELISLEENIKVIPNIKIDNNNLDKNNNNELIVELLEETKNINNYKNNYKNNYSDDKFDNEITNKISMQNKEECYQEFVADENYALYISEAVENNCNIKTNNSSELKKKNKKDKNIFVSSIIKDESKTIVKNESSIFFKTDKVSKKDIEDISINLKVTLNLEQIQTYAIKLGINIYEGSTKSGKPKNKTKAILIEQIKQSIKDIDIK